MFDEVLFAFDKTKTGYIAGKGDGILTVAGKPSERYIYLLDSKTLALVGRAASIKTGNYMFRNLPLDGEYLVIARDYQRRYEPFAWDCVKPADDLTIDEQSLLWASWQ